MLPAPKRWCGKCGHAGREIGKVPASQAGHCLIRRGKTAVLSPMPLQHTRGVMPLRATPIVQIPSCIAPLGRAFLVGTLGAAALLLTACDEARVKVTWSGDLLRNEALKAGSYLGVTIDGVTLVHGAHVRACLVPQAGASVSAQGIALDPVRGGPPFFPDLSLVTAQGDVAPMRPVAAGRFAEASIELCFEPAAPLTRRDYTMLRLTTPVSFTVQRLSWRAS